MKTHSISSLATLYSRIDKCFTKITFKNHRKFSHKSLIVTQIQRNENHRKCVYVQQLHFSLYQTHCITVHFHIISSQFLFFSLVGQTKTEKVRIPCNAVKEMRNVTCV